MDLEQIGVKIFESELSAGSSESQSQIPSSIKETKIDYIIDNFSKGSTVETFISLAKASQVQQYLFISSAGMYKGEGAMPMLETEPVKANDVRDAELAIEASGLAFTFLRPQYIYGPRASKRYLDHFLGRAYRKLHIALPLHGEQLVSLTHVSDVCSLIASALGHPAALNEVFNCVTDRVVGYRSLAEQCHKAFGNSDDDVKFLYYDPDEFSSWKSSDPLVRFPFRSQTFIASPSKAKRVLGWRPRRDVLSDLAEEARAYEATGGRRQKWGLDQLRYDLEVVASKDYTFMFTYPFFDEDAINPEKRPYAFEAGPQFAEAENN